MGIWETSESEPLAKASKQNYDDIKTGAYSRFQDGAWRLPTYWPCDVRRRGGVNLIRAFVWNLRTWSAMFKGNGTSGSTVRHKVPMRRLRLGLPHSSVEAR